VNIVYNMDGLIVSVPSEPESYAEYVKQNLSIMHIDSDYDCLNCILSGDVFLIQPTEFHTASKNKWILTQENYALLVQTVNMISTQIMTRLTNIVVDDIWFASVSNNMLESNKVKAFLKLRELIADAPKYVNVSHYFEVA
jgi:hypothetical protein